MKSKPALICLVIVVVAVGLYGLWSWTVGELFHASPAMGADGRPDHASFLNKKLGELPISDRQDFLYDYIAALDGEGLGDLFAQQQAIKPFLRAQILVLAGQRAADVAPALLLEQLVAIKPLPHSAITHLIKAWGEYDFNAAYAATTALSKKSLRLRLQRGLLEVYAEENPEAAARFALGIENEENADSLFQDIFEQWGRKDPQAVLAFAREHKKEDQLSNFFAQWVLIDSMAATAALEAMDTPTRTKIVSSTLHRGLLSVENPTLARTLLEQYQPDNKQAREFAYLSFFQTRLRDYPDETLAEIGAIADADMRLAVMNGVIYDIAQWLPDTALVLLNQWMPMIAQDKRKEFFQKASWRLGKTDTIALLQIGKTYGILDSVLSSLIYNAPAQALEQIAAMLPDISFKEDYERSDAWRSLATKLYEQDPKAAFALLERTTEKKQKATIANAIVSSVAKDNLLRAMELYKTYKGQSQLAMSPYFLIMADLKAQDAPMLVSWVSENVDTYMQGHLLSDILGKTGMKDFKTATDILSTIPEGRIKDATLEKLAEVATTKMPWQEVQKWAETLNEPEFSKAVEQKIFANIAREDFEAGLQLLQRPDVLNNILEQRNKSQWGANTLLKNLIKEDAEQVLAVIQTLPHDQQTMLIPLYAKELRESDPPTALSLLVNNMDSQGYWEASVNIIHEWSDMDAAGAVAWMDANVAQPDDIQRGNLYMPAVNTWMEQSPMEASQWIATQPEGEFRDNMVTVLVRNEGERDPDGALAWAYTIGNEKKRNSNVQRVFQKWAESDAEAARNALSQAPISEDLRAKITQQINK